MLEAGDGAGHGRLDDVDFAGGSGEAASLAAGEEVVQVTDLHGSKLSPHSPAINSVDDTKRYQSLDKMEAAA
jgi:hypothetical protein